MMCKEAKFDRWIMLAIGGMCVFGSVIIARWITKGQLPPEAMALLGTIVGGLITTASKIIETVRGLWTDERFGKVTDQLATSAPAPEVPTKTTIEGEAA